MIKLREKLKINKIISSLKKNFKLKLISVLVGVVMWFLVIGGEDPDVTRQFRDIPIQFKGADILERQDLVMISPENPTVNIEVVGKRSDVYAINRSDIVAEIDLNLVATAGSHRVSINYQVPYTVQKKEVSDKEILLTLDKKISKVFDVGVEISGEVKNKNQVVAKKESSVDKVNVVGAATYVNKIVKVVTKVDVTGKEKDEVLLSNIFAVDENGLEVKNVVLDKVDTNVSIGFKNFKEVPIELVDINAPHEDIKILKKNLVPKVVSIVGDVKSLDAITSIKTKPLDLSQVKDSGVYDVLLDLPTDVSLVNNDLKFVANIDIDKKINKSLKVESKNIKIENSGDKSVVTLDKIAKEIEVTIRGYESEVAKITSDDIQLYVSVSETDLGKNVVIKMKELENIQLFKLSVDTVKVIEYMKNNE
ncbi:MAG: hypothetical protein PT934_03540 [Peptoniphilaceae bacterium]|uniref:CdaR family protein n=1 Tax=Parvimonas sp. TaxID=1944660 RepID=UPI002A7565AA|nr:hypothetical protein [Parvimonas sp.]MDD7764822.1 hypothetical protein [Peptoniphilaceae bacterium]MDY3050846.1 hypothetical protein [Parvimonas sp.]